MLHPILRKFRILFMVGGLTACVNISVAGEDGMNDGNEGKAWADLPLPELGVRLINSQPLSESRTQFWIRMPQIPLEWGTVHNVFDIEFEGPTSMKFIGSRVLEGGVLEVRNRLGTHPHVILVSELTPAPGRVQLVVRAQLDPEMGIGKELPEELPELNMCPRLERARGCFDSYPDPFSEIIRRCFIYTDKGRTFLDQTVRRKLSKFSDDDPRNNPPWIQIYGPIWRPVPKGADPTWNSRYNSSSDRFTIPIIGVVSRDRKHLIAVASDTAQKLCQAWAPCIHNYPQWDPKDAPPAARRWRMNIYIMPNDPDLLLERIAEDLPDAIKLQEKRVSATH